MFVLWWWSPWEGAEPADKPRIAAKRIHEPQRPPASGTQTPKHPPGADKYKTEQTPDAVKPSKDRDTNQTGPAKNNKSKTSDAGDDLPGKHRHRRFSQDGAERIAVAKGQKEFSAACGVSVNLG